MSDANTILGKKWIGGLYHLHNTSDTWDHWINDFENAYSWPIDLAEKTIKVIGENKKHITNKNVIDLACNLGYFVFSCSSIGAKTVLGLEVRQLYIDTFDKVKAHWPNKNISMLNANIENISELTSHLVDIDTILYTGHLYHTVNQIPILTAFTISSATCMIIESVDSTITTSKEFKEPSDDPLNGYINETSKLVPARALTIDETKKILESLGWIVTNENFIYNYNPNRFVITAIKK